jgi:YegS C-terminal NAD kinase beta sandwich-like domain
MRKGEPWGRPASAPPDREIHGTDADLAAWVAAAPGALVRFDPTAGSDLARAVGLAGGAGTDTELPMDALELADGTLALNMLVLGRPPDRLTRTARRIEMRVRLDDDMWFEGRATTFVCGVGQWLRGHDLIPRGHPGDGRAEVQVYRLRAPERRLMRARLPAGGHVPHPRILQRTACRIELEVARPVPLEVDGITKGTVSRLVAQVRPGAYRLLV